MKYAQIQALVPKGEHFDESGIINEGGFLSVAHLDNIEQTLATNAPALEQANSTIEAHVSTIEELNGTITTLQTEKETAEQQVATHAATIATLQAQVTELSKGPSSRKGSTPAAKQDEPQDKGEKPLYSSDELPQNKWVDQELAKQKKK